MNNSETPLWFNGKDIIEAMFCEEFLESNKLAFSGGAFFTVDGRMTDEIPLRREINDGIKYYAVKGVSRTINNILKLLKLAANRDDFAPDEQHIHLANGTLHLPAHLPRASRISSEADYPLRTDQMRLRRRSGCGF